MFHSVNFLHILYFQLYFCLLPVQLYIICLNTGVAMDLIKKILVILQIGGINVLKHMLMMAKSEGNYQIFYENHETQGYKENDLRY